MDILADCAARQRRQENAGHPLVPSTKYVIEYGMVTFSIEISEIWEHVPRFRNSGKSSEIFGNLGRIYWVVFVGG